jgi:uncharacterized protein YqeY
MSVLATLNAKTMELRKGRDPLAGAFQATQAQATAYAKERAVKDGDLSDVKASDEDALRAIQRAIKQVRDTLSHNPAHTASQQELEILEALLPRMASEDEIRGSAEAYAATLAEKNMKQMGGLMAHLAAEFGTSLDKSKASQVAKAVLAA